MRGVRARAERASGRVLEGMAGADFRARLGVSLTEALIELNAQRVQCARIWVIGQVRPLDAQADAGFHPSPLSRLHTAVP